MICSRCGTELDDVWSFCPKCGARKGGDPAEMMGRDLFSQLLDSFKDSVKDGEDLGKAMEKTIQSGFFGGKGNVPFKVEIRAGRAKPAGSSPGKPGTAPRVRDGNGGPVVDQSAASRPFTRNPEEPRTVLTKRSDGRLSVDVHLDGIDSPGDVFVKELPSSAEVKAEAAERSYFKIVNKSPGTRIRSQSFSGGVLRMEIY